VGGTLKKLALVTDDIDELTEVASYGLGDSVGFDLEYLQLESGPLCASYTGIRGSVECSAGSTTARPCLRPGHHRYGRGLHVRGSTSPNSLGLLSLLSPKPIRFNGREMAVGDKTSILRPPPVVWRAGVGTALAWLTAPDAHATLEDARCSSTTRAVIEAATQAVAQSQPGRDVPSVSTIERTRIARAVRNRMDEALGRPLTTAELCEVAGCRARWLEISFKQHYGLAPIAYHRFLRMRAAHDELCRMRPDETSVTGVALDHGFHHLGRFSVGYRALFGKSPSATLARPPHRSGGSGDPKPQRRSA
jgi:AraC-like DNA-binding protein